MDIFRAKKHENINKTIFNVILNHAIADHCMIESQYDKGCINSFSIVETNLFEFSVKNCIRIQNVNVAK